MFERILKTIPRKNKNRSTDKLVIITIYGEAN